MVLGTAHSKLDHAIRWGANAYEYADTYQDELLANLWPAGPTGQEAQQQVQLRRARLGAQLRMEDDWRVLTGDADDGTSSAGTWDEGTASGGGGSGWS